MPTPSLLFSSYMREILHKILKSFFFFRPNNLKPYKSLLRHQGPSLVELKWKHHQNMLEKGKKKNAVTLLKFIKNITKQLRVISQDFSNKTKWCKLIPGKKICTICLKKLTESSVWHCFTINWRPTTDFYHFFR